MSTFRAATEIAPTSCFLYLSPLVAYQGQQPKMTLQYYRLIRTNRLEQKKVSMPSSTFTSSPNTPCSLEHLEISVVKYLRNPKSYRGKNWKYQHPSKSFEVLETILSLFEPYRFHAPRMNLRLPASSHIPLCSITAKNTPLSPSFFRCGIHSIIRTTINIAQVEDTLFRIPREYSAQESSVFADMLAIGGNVNPSGEGSGDNSPIILPETVNTKSFRALLKVLHSQDS